MVSGVTTSCSGFCRTNRDGNERARLKDDHERQKIKRERRHPKERDRRYVSGDVQSDGKKQPGRNRRERDPCGDLRRTRSWVLALTLPYALYYVADPMNGVEHRVLWQQAPALIWPVFGRETKSFVHLAIAISV